jgi:5-methylcytosine-specific restriction endonuclease McrA
MPLVLPKKACAFCDKPLVLKVRRDIARKRYCSHSCRQKKRYLLGEIDMEHMRSFNNTPEINAKKVHRGTSHPRYKHDRSTIKHRPRYELTAWRKAVFERDNFTCRGCGQRGGRLQAHHIKSYAAYPELRWLVDNGETLCEKCHKKTPNYGARAGKERTHAICQ